MQATEQWSMRVSRQDKKMLKVVAKHFHRTQSSAIKTLVREVYEIIKSDSNQERNPNQEQPAAI